MLLSVVGDSRAERSQLAGRTSLSASLGTSDSFTHARKMEVRYKRSMVRASSLAADMTQIRYFAVSTDPGMQLMTQDPLEKSEGVSVFKLTETPTLGVLDCCLAAGCAAGS